MITILLALFALFMVVGLVYVLFVSADAIVWLFPIAAILFAGMAAFIVIGVLLR